MAVASRARVPCGMVRNDLFPALGILLALDARAANSDRTPHCDGELLYNNICRPGKPANVPLPLDRSVQHVPYLVEAHPAVVDVSLGRQLFVDNFLIDDAATNLSRSWYSGSYFNNGNDGQVLKADRPWEGDRGVQRQALPFSGGAFWDSREKHLKLYYTCGATEAGWPCTNPAVPKIKGCSVNTCLATSTDGGLTFLKPDFDGNGTNIVRKVGLGYDGAETWLDHRASDPTRRFVMSEVRGPLFDAFSILTSADGVNWTERVSRSGHIIDRSTFFFNPFRDVWVWSIKAQRAAGRVRQYWETQNMWTNTNWSRCEWNGKGSGPGCPGAPIPWQQADVDDVHLVPGFTPQIYALDVWAYESLLVGSFSILECKHNDFAACPGVCPENCSAGTQEYNEVFLGFSRDGWSFSKPPAPRVPFAAADQAAKNGDRGNRSSWNYQNVQSVAGGVLVWGDELRMIVSGRSFAADTCGAGLLTLRRDGFASMNAPRGGGVLTTRTLVWHSELHYLWVNCANCADLRVAVLDESGVESSLFSTAASVPFSGDSTRHLMSWRAPHDTHGLAPVAGRALKLRFTMAAGRLFSFWLSADCCGASRGFFAGGGPELDGDRDTWGSCAP